MNPHREKQPAPEGGLEADTLGWGGMDTGGTSGLPPPPLGSLFHFSILLWKLSYSLKERVPVLPDPSPKDCHNQASPSPTVLRSPGERQKRVYAAQRGQSWEGPGQRPLPWGDRGQIEPQPLWVHISAWEIQDDKSAEEDGMGRQGGS